MNRGSDSDSRLEQKVSRIRSISDFLLRTESGTSDGSTDAHAIDRDDSDFFDDDVEEMEMEMEIEMLVAAEEEVRFREEVPPISSLNLRLQHQGETARKGTSQMKTLPCLTGNSYPQVRYIFGSERNFL